MGGRTLGDVSYTIEETKQKTKKKGEGKRGPNKTKIIRRVHKGKKKGGGEKFLFGYEGRKRQKF